MKAGTNLINKLHSLLSSDAPNGADLLVVEQHTIKFVSGDEHLRTERGRDELGG